MTYAEEQITLTRMTTAVEPTAYVPFPSYEAWKSESFDWKVFDTIPDIKRSFEGVSPEIYKAAIAQVRNVAAIETGAIEGLYDSDRGLTLTAATEIAILDAVQSKHGGRIRAYVESQINSYEYVLDFATGSQPIAEAWIRALHAQICNHQETYTAHTEQGPQERPLPKGEYKQQPNHVRTASGAFHAHAPPNETAAEMNRLLLEFGSAAFLLAHPLDQAAYAHHALTVIHPFTDGNGRVARAFASLFTYRRYSLPLLIYSEQRQKYFDALEEADRGRFAALRLFIGRAVNSAASVVGSSIRLTQAGAPAELLSNVGRVYETRGGYLQVEIDNACNKISQIVHDEVKGLMNKLKSDPSQAQTLGTIKFDCSMATVNDSPTVKEHRWPINPAGLMVLLTASTRAPAEASAEETVRSSVPRNAAREDVFIVDARPSGEKITVLVEDFMEGRDSQFRIEAHFLAQQVVGALLRRVTKAAAQQMKSRGYE